MIAIFQIWTPKLNFTINYNNLEGKTLKFKEFKAKPHSRYCQAV